ncbi:MAG: Fur family transcriptional regulator [Pelolinea sp.]|nr:Fur family transcriptional regulator [Pelolinea sp.]
MDKQSIWSIDKWENELSRSGCRITRPRRVILNIIAASSRPLTPMEIFDQARAVTPNIGLVTVYRTVEKLEGLKLIDRVHHLGQCQTVFRGTRGHQHLLVCTECGRSAYFDGLEAEKQFTTIGNSHGYKITGHWLQLSGLCQECQKKETT